MTEQTNSQNKTLVLGTTKNPGIINWAKVIKPVTKMEGNEDDLQDKEYSVDLCLPEEQALPLIEKIKAFYEKEGENPNKFPFDNDKFYKCWKVLNGEKDKKDYGECEGLYSFKAKTKAYFKDGKLNKVKIYNAFAQQLNDFDQMIGNGSKGCVSTRMFCWSNAGKYGVSLGLHSLQIIKFVEYTDDPGFEASDDSAGFTGEISENDFTGNVNNSEENQGELKL